jgi:uncharacterized protein DUF2877
MSSLILDRGELASIQSDLVIPAASFDAGLGDFLYAASRTKVHSVFESTINIINNDMVAGIHCRKDYFPGCIRLELDEFRLLKECCQNLHPGDVVWIDNGLIQFCCLTVVVNVANAKPVYLPKKDLLGVYNSCLVENLMALANYTNSLSAGKWTQKGVSDCISETQFGVLQLLKELCHLYVSGIILRFDYPEAPFTSVGKKCINELVAGCRKCNEDDLFASAENLIGFGQGLTPAGDDILTGFMAVLSMFPQEWISPDFFDEVLKIAVLKTNSIAYTYMKLASRKNISNILKNVINTACSADFDSMLCSLFQLTDWGGGSGRDIAFGAILGLLVVSKISHIRLNC